MKNVIKFSIHYFNIEIIKKRHNFQLPLKITARNLNNLTEKKVEYKASAKKSKQQKSKAIASIQQLESNQNIEFL